MGMLLNYISVQMFYSKLEIHVVFTIAVPAFDILFGCVLNTKIAYTCTTAEKLTFEAFY